MWIFLPSTSYPCVLTQEVLTSDCGSRFQWLASAATWRERSTAAEASVPRRRHAAALVPSQQGFGVQKRLCRSRITPSADDKRPSAQRKRRKGLGQSCPICGIIRNDDPALLSVLPVRTPFPQQFAGSLRALDASGRSFAAGRSVAHYRLPTIGTPLLRWACSPRPMLCGRVPGKTCRLEWRHGTQECMRHVSAARLV